MNLDSLNKWLSLFANVGVLLGIVFLAIEIDQQGESIDQANRIALRDSRVEILQFASSFNESIVEYPEQVELYRKFRFNEDLTPNEEEMAFWLGMGYINFWSALNASIDAGLMTDQSVNGYTQFALNLMELYPGIAPYLSKAIETTTFGALESSGPVIDAVIEKLRILGY